MIDDPIGKAMDAAHEAGYYEALMDVIAWVEAHTTLAEQSVDEGYLIAHQLLNGKSRLK